jgi:hypothetical protein
MQVNKIVGMGAPVEFVETLEALANTHHEKLEVDVIRAYHFGSRFMVEVRLHGCSCHSCPACGGSENEKGFLLSLFVAGGGHYARQHECPRITRHRPAAPAQGTRRLTEDSSKFDKCTAHCVHHQRELWAIRRTGTC